MAEKRKAVRHTHKYYFRLAATYTRKARAYLVRAEHAKKLSDGFAKKAQDTIKLAERMRERELDAAKRRRETRGKRATAARRRVVTTTEVKGKRRVTGRVTGRVSREKKEALRQASR